VVASGEILMRRRPPMNSMGISDLVVFIGVVVGIFALVFWLAGR
jgi:hypothetical protein